MRSPHAGSRRKRGCSQNTIIALLLCSNLLTFLLWLGGGRGGGDCIVVPAARLPRLHSATKASGSAADDYPAPDSPPPPAPEDVSQGPLVGLKAAAADPDPRPITPSGSPELAQHPAVEAARAAVATQAAVREVIKEEGDKDEVDSSDPSEWVEKLARLSREVNVRSDVHVDAAFKNGIDAAGGESDGKPGITTAAVWLRKRITIAEAVEGRTRKICCAIHIATRQNTIQGETKAPLWAGHCDFSRGFQLVAAGSEPSSEWVSTYTTDSLDAHGSPFLTADVFHRVLTDIYNEGEPKKEWDCDYFLIVPSTTFVILENVHAVLGDLEMQSQKGDSDQDARPAVIASTMQLHGNTGQVAESIDVGGGLVIAKQALQKFVTSSESCMQSKKLVNIGRALYSCTKYWRSRDSDDYNAKAAKSLGLMSLAFTEWVQSTPLRQLSGETAFLCGVSPQLQQLFYDWTYKSMTSSNVEAAQDSTKSVIVAEGDTFSHERGASAVPALTFDLAHKGELSVWGVLNLDIHSSAVTDHASQSNGHLLCVTSTLVGGAKGVLQLRMAYESWGFKCNTFWGFVNDKMISLENMKRAGVIDQLPGYIKPIPPLGRRPEEVTFENNVQVKRAILQFVNKASFEWLVLSEHDSFVVVDNMLSELASVVEDRGFVEDRGMLYPLYFGHVVEEPSGNNWEGGISYATAGAGIVVNRAAVTQVMKIWHTPECGSNLISYKFDVVLGRCLAKVNAVPKSFHSVAATQFHWLNPGSVAFESGISSISSRVVTFNSCSPEWMDKLSVALTGNQVNAVQQFLQLQQGEINQDQTDAIDQSHEVGVHAVEQSEVAWSSAPPRGDDKDTTLLLIQLPGGSTLRQRFRADDVLSTVRDVATKEGADAPGAVNDDRTILQAGSRKFNRADEAVFTLQDVGLVPTGTVALTLTSVSSRGLSGVSARDIVSRPAATSHPAALTAPHPYLVKLHQAYMSDKVEPELSRNISYGSKYIGERLERPRSTSASYIITPSEIASWLGRPIRLHVDSSIVDVAPIDDALLKDGTMSPGCMKSEAGCWLHCPVPCFASSNNSEEAHRAVDTFIGWGPGVPEIKKNSHTEAPTALAFRMEAIVEKPQGYDWLASVKKTSDVPISYFGSWVQRQWEKSASVDGFQEQLLATFVSNCGGGGEYHGLHRDWYIGELTKHVAVANYGKCHHNADWPQGVSKIVLASRHMFYCAFENSIARDYVSEKIMQGWMSGSVPVYLGTASIAEFAPAPNSYINAMDFDGPQELAEHLKHLAAHPDEYQAMLEWRQDANAVKKMDRLFEISQDTFLCRTCVLSAREIHFRRHSGRRAESVTLH